MKKFENPAIEVQVFAIEDVITTSTTQGGGMGGGMGGDNETEMD